MVFHTFPALPGIWGALEPPGWGGQGAAAECLQMSGGPALGIWESKKGVHCGGGGRGPCELAGQGSESPSAQGPQPSEGGKCVGVGDAVCTYELFMECSEESCLFLDLRRTFSLPK